MSSWRRVLLFAGANQINETPPGNFRNKATLVCRDAVVHHFLGEALHLLGCLTHVASVEWWMGVVFDDQLNCFRVLLADDLTGQPKPQIDTCRHASSCNNLARAHDAFVGPGLRAHNPKYRA